MNPLVSSTQSLNVHHSCFSRPTFRKSLHTSGLIPAGTVAVNISTSSLSLTLFQ
jgi:hypothetical protein